MSSSWYMITPTAATVKFYGFEKVAAKAAGDIGARLHASQTVSGRLARDELLRFRSATVDPGQRPTCSVPPSASRRVCPRARSEVEGEETRSMRPLDREALQLLLRRLQTPTLSFEAALSARHEAPTAAVQQQQQQQQQQLTTDVALDGGRASAAGKRTGDSDGESRGFGASVLKRLSRPTTASRHKRVGVCALCCELEQSETDDNDYDRWVRWGGGELQGPAASARELAVVIERIRSPTFASTAGGGGGGRPKPYCRVCSSTATAAATTAVADAGAGVRYRSSRPASAFSEPLVCGLARSPTVQHIVERLYAARQRSAVADASARMPNSARRASAPSTSSAAAADSHGATACRIKA